MSCTTNENEVSFPTVKEYVEHEKSGHKTMPKVEASKVPDVVKTPDNPPSGTPVPGKKPIILEYRYKGTHDCENEVDTLGIEVGDSFYVIAYCNTCRIKVTDQRVIPLEKQIIDFTKGKIVIEKKR